MVSRSMTSAGVGKSLTFFQEPHRGNQGIVTCLARRRTPPYRSRPRSAPTAADCPRKPRRLILLVMMPHSVATNLIRLVLRPAPQVVRPQGIC